MPKRHRRIAIAFGAAGVAVLLTNIVLAGFHADSVAMRSIGFTLFMTGLGVAGYWRYRAPRE